MESSKPAQNIQDSFLNTARKERLSITIYLLSGVKLTGRIRSFDKYSVVLEANGQEQLIFKHAISTVVMGRTVSHGAHLAHPEAKAAAAAGGARQRRPIGAGSGLGGERLGHRRVRRFRLAQFSSQEDPRSCVRRRTCASRRRRPRAVAREDSQERAFLVGIDVRTRGRSGAKGTVTAQAQAARDAASAAPRRLRRLADRARESPAPTSRAFRSLTRKNRWPNCARWRRARARKLSAKFCSGATGPIPPR